MDRDVKIIMMPGSNYNEHLGVQYNCFGGTQMINPVQSVVASEAKDSNEVSAETPQEKSNSAQNTSDGEKLLKAAILMFAQKCNRSRTYKWGLAYQALIRKGLIGRIGPTEFGRLVERIAGISSSTVRHDSEYFDYKEKYESTIDNMVAMIESLSNM